MVGGGLGGKHLRIVAAAAKTSKSFHVFINSLTKKPKKTKEKRRPPLANSYLFSLPPSPLAK